MVREGEKGNRNNERKSERIYYVFFSSFSPEVRKVFSPPLPATETDDMVVYQRKKLEEEDEWIPASHRDRNSRRKTRRRKSFSGPKVNGQTYTVTHSLSLSLSSLLSPLPQTLSKSLQHNATIFGQFIRLGLQPPITSADISKVSDQLRGLLVSLFRLYCQEFVLAQDW